ncbi:MAG: hypothetical protein DMG17_17420 [Acidobacteria bacterium]|nr:MAG: hypothetical protein DMG17_17420 [Acidobacteriota bacterium]
MIGGELDSDSTLIKKRPSGATSYCEDARGSTHASLSRQAGIDPKLVADQLGHGLGVNLDVYTRRRPRQPARRGGGAGVRTGPSRFGLKVRKSFVSGEAFTTASFPSRQ